MTLYIFVMSVLIAVFAVVLGVFLYGLFFYKGEREPEQHTKHVTKAPAPAGPMVEGKRKLATWEEK